MSNGRAISLKGTFFAGARVAGQLLYVPAHIKNGKKINSRCEIPVYRNSHRGTNAKTGEKGRVDTFKLVAWGKLADTCAKSLPKGKAIDAFAEPQSFLGNLFNRDGSLRLDNTGQAVQTTKISFTILNIVFGEESAKAIAEEIQSGRRPANWNIPNHPDYQLWTSMLQQRQAVTWDGQSTEFGYARVVIPQGQGIQLDFSQPAANVAPANTGMPGMVAHAANTMAPTAAVNPNVASPIAQPAQVPANGQMVAQPAVQPVQTAAPAATGQALF